jgi:hypothetical protein
VKKKIRVRMKVSISGLPMPQYDLDEWSFQPEHIVELHPDLAEIWIRGGHAEAVDDSVPLTGSETASLEPPEKAIFAPGAAKKPGR